MIKHITIIATAAILFLPIARAEEHNILQALEELALLTEREVGSDGPSVVKWMKQIYVAEYFVPKTVHSVVSKSMIEAKSINGINIRYKMNNANLIIIGIDVLGDDAYKSYRNVMSTIIADERVLHKFLSTKWHVGEHCKLHMSGGRAIPVSIDGVVIIINLASETSEQMYCAANSIASSLGLLSGWISKNKHSIFTVKTTRPPFLQEDDISALRILYDKRMVTGINRSEALKIARTIVVESK